MSELITNADFNTNFNNNMDDWGSNAWSTVSGVLYDASYVPEFGVYNTWYFLGFTINNIDDFIYLSTALFPPGNIDGYWFNYYFGNNQLNILVNGVVGMNEERAVFSNTYIDLQKGATHKLQCTVNVKNSEYSTNTLPSAIVKLVLIPLDADVYNLYNGAIEFTELVGSITSPTTQTLTWTFAAPNLDSSGTGTTSTTHQFAFAIVAGNQIHYTYTASPHSPTNYSSVHYTFDSVSLTELVAVPEISDIEGNANSVIVFGDGSPIEATDDLSNQPQNLEHPLPAGWCMFSVPFDLATLQKNWGTDSDTVVGEANYDLVDFLKDHLWRDNGTDTKPIFYQLDGGNNANHPNFTATVIIAKNNLGAAYLPQFDFNGIGNVLQLQGYQIKVNEDCVLKFRGDAYNDSTTNTTDINYSFTNGWNMVCFASLTPIDCVEFFAPINDAGELIIVKDYLGAVYLPQFDFNGIGNLQPGQGYQVKFDFS